MFLEGDQGTEIECNGHAKSVTKKQVHSLTPKVSTKKRKFTNIEIYAKTA